MKYLSIIIFSLISSLLAQDMPAYVKITLQDGQELLVSLVSETDSTLTTKNLDGEIGTISKDAILLREDITTYIVVDSELETVPSSGLRYILAEALQMENYEHPKNPWQTKFGFGDGVLISMTRSFEINVLKDIGLKPTASIGMQSLQIPWLRRGKTGNVIDSSFVSDAMTPFMMAGLDWIKKKGPSHLTLKFGIGGRGTPRELNDNSQNISIVALGMELGHGPYTIEMQSFYSLSPSTALNVRANIYSIGYTSWDLVESVRFPAITMIGMVVLNQLWNRL